MPLPLTLALPFPMPVPIHQLELCESEPGQGPSRRDDFRHYQQSGIHTHAHTQEEQKFCHPWANNRTSVQQQFVLNAKMDKASARRASPAGRQQDAKSNPLIIYETAKSKQQVASGQWQVADCGTEGAA